MNMSDPEDELLRKMPPGEVYVLEPGGIQYETEEKPKPEPKRANKAGNYCSACGEFLSVLETPKAALDMIVKAHNSQKHVIQT